MNNKVCLKICKFYFKFYLMINLVLFRFLNISVDLNDMKKLFNKLENIKVGEKLIMLILSDVFFKDILKVLEMVCV